MNTELFAGGFFGSIGICLLIDYLFAVLRMDSKKYMTPALTAVAFGLSFFDDGLWKTMHAVRFLFLCVVVSTKVGALSVWHIVNLAFLTNTVFFETTKHFAQAFDAIDILVFLLLCFNVKREHSRALWIVFTVVRVLLFGGHIYLNILRSSPIFIKSICFITWLIQFKLSVEFYSYIKPPEALVHISNDSDSINDLDKNSNDLDKNSDVFQTKTILIRKHNPVSIDGHDNKQCTE